MPICCTYRSLLRSWRRICPRWQACWQSWPLRQIETRWGRFCASLNRMMIEWTKQVIHNTHRPWQIYKCLQTRVLLFGSSTCWGCGFVYFKQTYLVQRSPRAAEAPSDDQLKQQRCLCQTSCKLTTKLHSYINILFRCITAFVESDGLEDVGHKKTIDDESWRVL